MSEFPEAKHAFAINPPGPVPYSGFQVFGIFLLAFPPALALAACGLRVYSRRLSAGLGLDDWLIFLAAMLGVPQAVFATLCTATEFRRAAQLRIRTLLTWLPSLTSRMLGYPRR
ncbi:hypothetical protein F5144DRAFT_306994 [Chaetomium tenue]|uniref:Uncharacterized protein n=1 Tax=Chaetomium tenue TaxID=1854479 RepID=A0ACB7P599_9PEZI|nr:hypothetical protein F5144DRAFT_306994 [Chaetomium globosum]